MTMPAMTGGGQHVLLDLGAYLKEHENASMRDLCSHFRLEPEALRGMLDHWIRKGRVTRLDFTAGCGCGTCGAKSCGACGIEDSFEIYEWRKRPGIA